VDLWKICYVDKNKPSPTFLTVLDEKWEGEKFRRIERIISPPVMGEIQRGSEIMKGLLMAFFAIYRQVRTGFIVRVTFRKGFFASFLVPTKSFYHVGIPSEPRQEKRE